MGRPMTKTGFQCIQDEMDHLWRNERPEIVRQVSAAADLGDRSENAAYIYGKRRLREIDSRIRYLRRKIEDVTIVDVNEAWKVDRAAFLSKSHNTPFDGWDLTGRARYTIVGGEIVWQANG